MNSSEIKIRSCCPIANTLDIFGDKWTLLVIRDLFAGRKTYGEFHNSPESIPTNLLADRLKRLELHGIIDKNPYQERPKRYTYTLTTKGQALAPVLSTLSQWGIQNIPGTEARMKLDV